MLPNRERQQLLLNKLLYELSDGEAWYLKFQWGHLWLVTRTHNLGDTEYYRHARVNAAEARWLRDTTFSVGTITVNRKVSIAEFWGDDIAKYERYIESKLPVVGPFIGA